MKKTLLTHTWSGCVIAVLLVTQAYGSGSYSSRMPRPPTNRSTGMKIDSEKYNLGKSIFDGKATLVPTGDAGAQKPRLTTLQGRLPESVMKKKSLPDLAGKLSESQLSALEYFVQQKFTAK